MRSFAMIAFAVLTLSACSTTNDVAMPNFLNGHYYMAGDPTCKNARNITRTRIMCMTAEGQDTGWRDAMTPQQIQMWQFQQQQAMMAAQIQSQQIASMNAQIAQNNAQMQAHTAATLANASVYQPPQVMAIPSAGGNQVRCIGVGIYANCRY